MHATVTEKSDYVRLLQYNALAIDYVSSFSCLAAVPRGPFFWDNVVLFGIVIDALLTLIYRTEGLADYANDRSIKHRPFFNRA